MNNIPHVVLDALLVNRQPTGVGRSILELVRALAAEPRGMRFSLLATEPDMFSWLADNTDWCVVPCPEAAGGTLRKALFTQWRLPGLVKRLGGCLLHSLQFVAPLRLTVPSVVTVHDLAYLHYPGTVEQPRRAYYGLLVPPTLRRAAAIVTNSRATADDVGSTFPRTASSISVTPFGTPSWIWDAMAVGTADGGSGSVAGATEGRPYLLFVGTLEPRKNLEGLLTAYKRFRRQAAAELPSGDVLPDLLLVGGRGWKDSRLRSLMEPLMKAGCLRVEDYCGPEDLYRHYQAARALLLPSLHEGFGFPILEAMALGLPVLTSSRGAMLEVAGEEAVLVDPDDPDDMVRGLVRIFTDVDLRRRSRDRGPQRARTWTWERTAAATVEVYRRVLEIS